MSKKLNSKGTAKKKAGKAPPPDSGKPPKPETRRIPTIPTVMR